RGRVLSLAFAPTEQRLVSGSADGTAMVWDLVTGVGRRALAGHDGPVRSVAVSTDGQLIATGSQDGSVKVWTPHGHAKGTLAGHRAAIWSVALDPTTRRLA